MVMWSIRSPNRSTSPPICSPVPIRAAASARPSPRSSVASTAARSRSRSSSSPILVATSWPARWSPTWPPPWCSTTMCAAWWSSSCCRTSSTRSWRSGKGWGRPVKPSSSAPTSGCAPMPGWPPSSASRTASAPTSGRCRPPSSPRPFPASRELASFSPTMKTRCWPPTPRWRYSIPSGPLSPRFRPGKPMPPSASSKHWWSCWERAPCCCSSSSPAGSPTPSRRRCALSLRRRSRWPMAPWITPSPSPAPTTTSTGWPSRFAICSVRSRRRSSSSSGKPRSCNSRSSWPTGRTSACSRPTSWRMSCWPTPPMSCALPFTASRGWRNPCSPASRIWPKASRNSLAS